MREIKQREFIIHAFVIDEYETMILIIKLQIGMAFGYQKIISQ